MASFTISNANSWWANGTSVSVYAQDAFGNQTGSSVDSASVSSGAVTFSNLTEGSRYIATANSKSVKFHVSTASSGGGGGSLPAGGTAGQLLEKQSGTDGDADWADPPEGTMPSDNTDGQVLGSVGTTATWLDVDTAVTPADIGAASATDLTDHTGDTTGAHAASAISVAAITDVTGDDVQEVLEDLKDQIDAGGGGSSGPGPVVEATASGLTSITFPVATANASSAPTAGRIYLMRLLDFPQTLLTKACCDLGTFGVGTGANIFMGLYYQSGTNLVLAGKTSDQQAAWTSTDFQSATLTAESGQSLTRGGSSDKCWWAMLVGTAHNTTPAALRRAGGGDTNTMNGTLVAGTDAIRSAFFGSGKSSLDATIALSGLSGNNLFFWGGVK